MRTHFAAAAALALAACACAAHAQMPTFPAPAFRGGNTDWQVVLTTTQSDLSVSYRLSVPEADKAQEGSLGQRNAAYGEYRMAGVIGMEKSALTVKITAVPLGKPCKLDNGLMGDAYGRFTYSIEVIPQPSKPISTGSDHKPWPAKWSGCGNFTLD
ncbi:hypothetical protein [Lysobacter enzymogenes]|uniref:hypothetical protein n=1 Tax=Lysobacter enzymogenes TaxID=69 RepID=UPI000895D85E|nr:hypothetical protein [Lysobacter enzymogenes]SDX85606.1 hypothetical protein SAMN05421681_108199 [Lysobacter enzymogenes]